MNLEIGTDITSTQRIINAINRHGLSFLQRFLLPSEIFIAHKNRDLILDSNDFVAFPTHIPQNKKISTFTNSNDFIYENSIYNLSQNFDIQSFRQVSLSGFWAIKESISKAIGFGIGAELSFHDMCIYKDIFGKPHVALNKEKFENFKISNISVSMSHDAGFAMACAAIVFKD